ncbi:damage-inducible protein DinB [Leptospira ognonensis]|uniref:Damage-inducible protein DinB n=1 Tax=Leptospira ognonensis TaxID=2484945 RepID=A0A4R9K7Y5_9LEPT|nr:DinB family protein [Leptospira ognonensis]TGL61752.1 damage-inducible protein DinB [Leptospira ognonensis]
MELKNHLEILAKYHTWATDHLYLHLSGVSDTDYRKDSGLFFKSIHRTLNHLLVVDQLWFSRFAEGRSPVIALDLEIEMDREKLKDRLVDQTKKWEGLIKSAKSFPETLDYSTMRGFQSKIPFTPALAHVFNHGTHHRGQIIAAMTTAGYSSPEIDLVYMLQSQLPEHDE